MFNKFDGPNERTPKNGYFDLMGMFDYQQFNGDNSWKTRIPRYKYGQMGKLEGASTRTGQPYIQTIEDQTKYKISNNDGHDLNNLTGGNGSTARVFPGSEQREFKLSGNKDVRQEELGNNLSVFRNQTRQQQSEQSPIQDTPTTLEEQPSRTQSISSIQPRGAVPKTSQTRESFGSDKPVQWSTMPTANNYQNGSAHIQRSAPSFADSKQSAKGAHDRTSMTTWKESMKPILEDYGNTLAKVVTFGAWSPDKKEGYCPSYYGENRPSPAIGQITAVLTVIIVVLILVLIFMKVGVAFKNPQNKQVEQTQENIF